MFRLSCGSSGKQPARVACGSAACTPRACSRPIPPLHGPGMEHHVYFWLKEERQNEADRRAFEAGLDALLTVKGLVSGFWAVPAKVMERPVINQSWDYATSFTFESVAAQDAYQEDPDHYVFINAFKDWWAKVEVRDLERVSR